LLGRFSISRPVFLQTKTPRSKSAQNFCSSCSGVNRNSKTFISFPSCPYLNKKNGLSTFNQTGNCLNYLFAKKAPQKAQNQQKGSNAAIVHKRFDNPFKHHFIYK